MELIENEEFEEILDRQENRCAGCNEPLTSAGADWASHVTWCDIPENEGEEDREGYLRYKKARSLGGSRQELEDLEFMCTECMGTLTRSVRLPNFLVARAAEWVESHQRHQDLHDRDYDVRSFNHLVRVAIERFISTENEMPFIGNATPMDSSAELMILREAATKAKSKANDEMIDLDMMIIEIDEMKERLARFTD